MQCNVGKTDRIVRVVLGTVVVLLGFYFQRWWGLLGLLPLYTISIAWCPKVLFCAVPSRKWWHQCWPRVLLVLLPNTALNSHGSYILRQSLGRCC